jgi:glycosyltransferase involved in cell wall biosynthesis
MSALPVILKPGTQIFSHMTEVQSALLGPLTRLLRIRHFLWYAHTSKSFALRWSHFWISGIFTSTPGSCPIKGMKVFPIGQGVDSVAFPLVPLLAQKNRNNFLHFGRFDPSKKIDVILSTCQDLRAMGFRISFRQVGSASTDRYAERANYIQRNFKSQDWATFYPSINRNDIPLEVSKSSAFIHAYQGSLDKTLVEATLQGLPVLTINPEYIGIFGSWTGEALPSLKSECEVFLTAEIQHIEFEVKRRRQIALEHHTLEHWVEAVSNHYY